MYIMMKIYPLILGLFLLLFCSQCRESKLAKSSTTAPRPSVPTASTVPNRGLQQVSWEASERLMPVLEKAGQTKQPVWVVFYASWCMPCKVMEEEVFSQPTVYQYLNGHFLNFHTDYDSPAGRTIAEIYEVEKLPTLLFLSPNGIVLERHVGMLNASTLRSLGDAALAKMTP